MRRFVVSTVLVGLLGASGGAQDGQPQRFRGGVDLITIDVSATDGRGDPAGGAEWQIQCSGSREDEREIISIALGFDS